MANLNVLKDKLGNILNPHIPRYDILKYDLKVGSVVKTGEKRDGKDVYKKIIKVPSLPNNTITEYQHGISNYDNIWFDPSESFINTGDGRVTFPYLDGPEVRFVNVFTTKNTFRIFTGGDRTSWSAEVCLKFTMK